MESNNPSIQLRDDGCHIFGVDILQILISIEGDDYMFFKIACSELRQVAAETIFNPTNRATLQVPVSSRTVAGQGLGRLGWGRGDRRRSGPGCQAAAQ